VRRLPADREIPEDIEREILLYKSAGIGISDIQNILRVKHVRSGRKRNGENGFERTVRVRLTDENSVG